jgi:hypothetical protein
MVFFNEESRAMSKSFIAAAVAAALALAGSGLLQAQGSKGKAMEAVVKVTQVNSANRTVTVETPKGHTLVSVPDSIDLSQIQEGARYKVRYSEPVAVAVAPGGEGSAAAGATAELKSAGEGVKMEQVSGTVEQIDASGRQLVVRTADGMKQAYRLGEGVDAGSLKSGDPVSLTYQQAVATQMVSTPQPISDPAPAQ